MIGDPKSQASMDITFMTLNRPRPKIDCSECRHRGGTGFRDLGGPELSFMESFKHSHEVAWTHDVIIKEGQDLPLLFTLYSGMAMRCRMVSGGKSQLLSIILPGDLVGLEFLYRRISSCTVQAVTDVTYCRFDPERWRTELMRVPDLAHRVCERLLMDQRQVEDRLTAISACTAEGAIAHFFISLYDRLRVRRLCHEGSFALPLTNRQIADAVGITTVHLHRLLKRLERDGILTHDRHRVIVHNEEKLRELACLPTERGDRPLI